MKSPIVKRTVRIHGHKTTVSVEDPFWSDLKKIAHTQHATISKVIADIDNARQHGNLSSAIRLFVLDQVRNPSVAGASCLDVHFSRLGGFRFPHSDFEPVRTRARRRSAKWQQLPSHSLERPIASPSCRRGRPAASAIRGLKIPEWSANAKCLLLT